MNGIWLVFLLGRWSMVTGWRDLLVGAPVRSKREFVSVDARLDDLKKDTRSYEMLSRDKDEVVTPSVVTPLSPIHHRQSPSGHVRIPSATASITPNGLHSPVEFSTDGRRTPDYFGKTARYHAPARSFSSPRPPTANGGTSSAGPGAWDPSVTYAKPSSGEDYVNPLGMNRI
jgi:hypothetical protein